MKLPLKALLAIAAALVVTSAFGNFASFQAASSGSPTQYLAQQFSPAPVAMWGTVLENSSYAGPSFKARCPSAATTSDIAFSGKNASASALTTFLTSSCSGASTGLVTTVYDQSGGTCDQVQATAANMPVVLVDTDGKISFKGSATAQLATTCTTVKTATPHQFGVFYPGYVQDTTCGSYTMWWYDTDRFGLGLGPCDTFAAYMPRNGTLSIGQNYIQHAYGNAHLGGTTGFHVWDLLSTTATLRHDTTALTPGISTASITFPSTTQLNISNATTEGAYLGKWRFLAQYSSARADRDSITNFLMTDFSVTALPTTTTANGFNWSPQYFPDDSVFTPPNFWGMCWSQQDGGYPWSLWLGLQSNTSTTSLHRFEAKVGDNDVIENGSERSEISGTSNVYGTCASAQVAPGTDFEVFQQIYFEPGPSISADWLDSGQIHYGTGEITGSPDLFYVSLLGDQLQAITTANGSQTNRGSAQSYSRGVWYALLVQGHASAGHTTDTLQVYWGLNGAPLTQIVNLTSQAIWNNNTWDGYFKAGIYSFNLSAAFAMMVANYQVSNVAGTFNGYRTTQPTLPAP